MQQELEVGLIATLATTGEVQTASADIAIATSATSELIDVTDRIGSIVTDAGIVEGLALVSAPHTTCAVIVNVVSVTEADHRNTVGGVSSPLSGP